MPPKRSVAGGAGGAADKSGVKNIGNSNTASQPNCERADSGTDLMQEHTISGTIEPTMAAGTLPAATGPVDV
jgi:hypothetical protein